ncbi:MAG: ABC transporter permease [Acidimicrobiales bacterium]
MATVAEAPAPVPASAAIATDAVTTKPPHRRRSRQWRRPVGLEIFTWAYLAWSILPIGLAVLFSFNHGKSQSVFQGFSLEWYLSTSTKTPSVLHAANLHAAVIQTLWLAFLVTIITVPLGVGFAVGIDRWRSRTSSGLNLLMIFSFVIPELLLGVALLFLFQQSFKFVALGTPAEVAALVVWNISWPAIIVRARLTTIGKSYEEAAADLGASRARAIWRVLRPLLMPAIFASAVLVFATCIDDFVLVDLLSSTANTQTMAVLIYSQTHGGNNGPALNALATLMLAFSLVAAVIGYVAFRLMTKGERQSTTQALTDFAGI